MLQINDETMKTILFKAKRADGKGWVEGFPMYDLESSKWIIVVIIHYSGDGIENPPCDYQESFEIIPETLCQFINKTDKNGKHIFVGEVDKKGRVCDFFPDLGSTSRPSVNA